MEEALRTLLRSTAGVSALVGTRVNWGSRPQGSDLPAIVMYLIDDIEEHTQSGRDGLSRARVQINCHGANYMSSLEVARAVRVALDGYRGGQFQGIFLALSRSSREGGTNEPDRPFLHQLDFIVNWSNTND